MYTCNIHFVTFSRNSSWVICELTRFSNWHCLVNWSPCLITRWEGPFELSFTNYLFLFQWLGAWVYIFLVLVNKQLLEATEGSHLNWRVMIKSPTVAYGVLHTHSNLYKFLFILENILNKGHGMSQYPNVELKSQAKDFSKVDAAGTQCKVFCGGGWTVNVQTW